jgi:hypothetical protein
MSSIPPNIIGSVLQSGPAQREQAREIDVAKSSQAEAARRAAAGPDAFIEIEATDADTQVHTDGGGLGSQGRHDAPPEEPAAAAVDDPAVTLDEMGRPHLDLSA